MRQDLRIIIEGMDGTGKTYLIEQLQQRFPGTFQVVVNTLGPAQKFDEWWPAVLDIEKSPIVPLHDRFFYSELVYGPILRGTIEASPGVINNVMWFLRTTALLIYARPHSDLIRSRVYANPQMDGVHRHFQQLLELYDQTMSAELNWFGPRFIHYTADSADELKRVGDLVGAYLGVDH